MMFGVDVKQFGEWIVDCCRCALTIVFTAPVLLLGGTSIPRLIAASVRNCSAVVGPVVQTHVTWKGILCQTKAIMLWVKANN